MNKKSCLITAALIISALLTIRLTGFRLAIEDTAMNSSSEKLCGIFLTVGTVIPGMNQQASGSHIAEGRLVDNKTIVFGGIDGYFMGLVEIEEENGEKYNGLLADKEFHDGKLSINNTDNGEESSCEITFSVGTGFHQVVRLNPVYQKGDGIYYLEQGMGFMTSDVSEGAAYSQTIDNTFTETENGETKLRKASFKVNIDVVEPSDSLLIKEMNRKDEIIKYTEYDRNDPDNFTVDRNTEYVIVEEWKGRDTDAKVNRYIYSMNGSGGESPCHAWNLTEHNNIVIAKVIQFDK